MAYIDPRTVVSPRNRLSSTDVIYNHGQGGWAVALLNYDGHECVGIRWNGNDDEAGIGNPQSRGRPTWFVVPPDLAEVVRGVAEDLSNSQEGGLSAGYREMASDRAREAEADEWAEGLIGDAAGQEG